MTSTTPSSLSTWLTKTFPPSPKQWYQGACHCHAVEFKVSLPDLYARDSQRLMHCNCSICTKNGYVLLYPARTDLIWLKGEDKLKNYQFATKKRDHRFCSECGSSILIDMNGHSLWGDVLGLNARMLRDVDIEKLITMAEKGDGRNEVNAQFNEQTA